MLLCVLTEWPCRSIDEGDRYRVIERWMDGEIDR